MKSNRLIYLLLLIIFAWLLIISFSMKDNNTSNNETIINEYNISGFSTDFTNIYKDARNSIVTIQVDESTLSGFVYKQDNNRVYILTAYHGLANANNITVLFGFSYTVDAYILDYDHLLDLAVLYIDTPYQIEALKLGDSTLIKPGELVLSIGTPVSSDYAGSVELGMISDSILSIDNSITYNDEKINYYMNVIEMSSSLKAGYSGSPILNMNGEVIGMNTMSSNNNINFASTINEIKIVADNIINNNKIDKTLFGIKGKYIKDMASYEKNNLNIQIDTISGLFVSKVRENSLAYNMGLRNNDVIISINDKPINNLNDYLDICYAGSESYIFNIIRNGETINLVSSND